MSPFVEAPKEPLRPVVDAPEQLAQCIRALSEADGVVAFDVERAHGYRYWPKAYLLQIRRGDAGTWLIDPIAFEDGRDRADLSEVAGAVGEATWVIHAASQDLPSMAEVGIVPGRLVDTELGARLLGEPQVSLGALLESKLGVRLRKAHSAQNWAKRPLPEGWLEYAALDVDYLPELAELLVGELRQSGRWEWAEQEFAALLEHFAEPQEPRAEPWRRLSGITNLRTPRQLAVARALWEERDRIARERDRPSPHILPDQAIVTLAGQVQPSGPLPNPDNIAGFSHRGARRYRNNWVRTLRAAAALPRSAYPQLRPRHDGIPNPRNWSRTKPEAAELWQRVRPAVNDLACDLSLQPSLIAPPAALQAAVYLHDAEPDFGRTLVSHGARPWQVEFLQALLEEVAGS